MCKTLAYTFHSPPARHLDSLPQKKSPSDVKSKQDTEAVMGRGDRDCHFIHAGGSLVLKSDQFL